MQDPIAVHFIHPAALLSSVEPLSHNHQGCEKAQNFGVCLLSGA